MSKRTITPARTSDNPQPNGFAAKSTGTLVVKKVSVVHETVNGRQRYELETNQVNKYIHCDPNKEPDIYHDMLALVPAIADLRENEIANRSLTLRDPWRVNYKFDKRMMINNLREVMVATKIVQMESKRTDLPEWMSSVEELPALAYEYNFGPDFLDEILGLPRSSWESLAWAREKLSAKKKEVTELAAKVSKPAAQPPASDKLDDWFPRDEKENTTVTDKTLEDELTATADQQAEQDITFPHELDPDKALFAIPDHIAKTYGKDKAGKLVRDIYKMPLNDWFKAHDFDARMAWGLALDFESKNSVVENATEKPTENEQNQNVRVIEPDAPQAPSQPPAVSSEPTIVKTVDGLELDPLITNSKTLTGIPAAKIQEFINKPHMDQYYSSTDAPGGGKWTVIDPLAVRIRLDKVFGPHGIGWRIVPAPTGSSSSVTTYERKSGQKMYNVTLSGYCLEYRLRVGDAYEWERTSALTDSNDSPDLDYASGGAFTSLMKQALKMMGGYDHFALPKAA